MRYLKGFPLTLSMCMVLLLNACATPPPIPWAARRSYVEYAIEHVPRPKVGDQCVDMSAPFEPDNETLLINADYPWDRYTKISYVPHDVVSLAIRVVSEEWHLSAQAKQCTKMVVAMEHLAHGLAQGGLGAENPYGCVKVHWLIKPSNAEAKLIKGESIGSGYGYTVWWASRDNPKLIDDYNRTLYVALIRAVASGLVKAVGATDERLKPQTCKKPLGW